MKKTIFTYVALAVAFVLLVNLDVSIHEGINGRYRYVHMPLYVKWTQFLARHYEYTRLAREITVDCKNDKEKALAILIWTSENIKYIPAGMNIHDDHILNIIIRGYGVSEQFQDVFTTLCTYAGLPAYFVKVRDKTHAIEYALSLVKINGEWRVFDAYYGVYFKLPNGEFASVDDIIAGSPMDREGQRAPEMIRGVPYKEFYYDLQPVARPMTLRAERQMPIPRIFFEVKKVLKMERE